MLLTSMFAALIALLKPAKGAARVRKVIHTFRSMRSELEAGLNEMHEQRNDNADTIADLIATNKDITHSMEDAESVHAALGMFIPTVSE